MSIDPVVRELRNVVSALGTLANEVKRLRATVERRGSGNAQVDLFIEEIHPEESGS